MAEPTNTRTVLRQDIARQVGMPFFRRFPAGIVVQDTVESGLTTGSDSTALKDGRLTQTRNYWINTWVYNVTTDETRLTVDFLQESNSLIPEYDWTTTPSTLHTIEIFNIYNPDEIHLAIDDAIAEAFPTFFDVVTFEEMIIEEDKLEYELVTNNLDGRGVLSNPFRIKSVEVERTGLGNTYTATGSSTAAGTITDSVSATFTATDTGWMFSVFGGAGSGQFSSVTSGDSNGVLTLSTPTTLALDTTSKFRVWDAAAEVSPWEPIRAIQFDAKDYPSKMRMLERITPATGSRFRIQYVAEPQSLDTETSTTVVPKQYIKHYVLSDLFQQRARSKPGELQKYGALAQEESRLADKYKMEHAFDLPDQQIWTEQSYGSGVSDYFERDNPLGWGE